MMGDLRLSSITVRDVTALHAKVKETTTPHATTDAGAKDSTRRQVGLLEKNPASCLEKVQRAPRERY